jgi:hypothetical protein
MYSMKLIFLSLLFYSGLAIGSSNSILTDDEAFRVTPHNVEVKEITSNSIDLRANTDVYSIKLEPNREGNVIFSLSGIRFRSTALFSNLSFSVKITGYNEGNMIFPAFSIDDVNEDIVTDQNTVTFERIYGSIPVWFDQRLDSIHIEYSNSMTADVHQYVRINDLKIVTPIDVSPNPEIEPCEENEIMIAIDGSSSIDKTERKTVGNQLITFAKETKDSPCFGSLCVMEFGSGISSIVTSSKKKTLVDALQKYKRRKNHKRKSSSYTNWSVAFDEAIKRKPAVFVFITDGWSNWVGNHAISFTSVYHDLIQKSNTLKVNGTRILIITSDLDAHQGSKSILSKLLNSDETLELNEESLTIDSDLSAVDLISMTGFSKMSELQFSSMITCSPEFQESNEVVDGSNTYSPAIIDEIPELEKE